MNIIDTTIPGVVVFEPVVHGDARGYFMETYRDSMLRDIGVESTFVQDNQSKSIKGTLRGLHYQLKHPQGKLVRVISGEIYDVAVDVRKNSKTFGQSVGVMLTETNRHQIWVPPGFAHGFYVTSDSAEIAYKCTDYYHPEDDNSLLWNDESLNIEWPLGDDAPLLSDKDRNGTPLGEAVVYE